MNKLLLIASIAFLGLTQSAQAGSRDSDRYGLFLGLISSPMPSVVGFNVGYNATSFLRVSAGYGTTSLSGTGYKIDATTLGVDGKVLIPGFNLSPYASVGFSNISMTVTGTGADTSKLGGLTGSAATLTYGVGLDWQMWFGLNLGFDYKIISKTGDSLPGFYLGFYF